LKQNHQKGYNVLGRDLQDRPILKNLGGMSRKYLACIKQQIEKIATHALDLIERNIGKEGIEKALHERQSELFDQYYKRLKDLDF
jgi:hypothetical protein